MTILFAFAVMFFVAAYLHHMKQDQLAIQERLRTYTVREQKSYLPPDLQLAFRTRVINRSLGALIKLFKRIIPKNEKDAYDAKLRTAGNPYGLNGDSYLVLKYVIFTICVLIGLSTRDIMYIIIFAGAGLGLPDLWLKAAAGRKEDEVLKELPNFLDLLNISVQAGLGFDSALQKVVQKNPGPLSRDFEKALKEMAMGKPRREALKDMSDQMNISEVSIFITAIVQAELLGVGIGNILEVQATQARENRRMQAEEKAMRAPIKMLIPLVIFIFPVIFIILLGPPAIKIMETL